MSCARGIWPPMAASCDATPKGKRGKGRGSIGAPGNGNSNGRGQARGSWSPLSLGSSLLQWFDPSDDAYLVKADSDTTINEMLDKSGNGNDSGSAASAALRPEVSSLNGVQCARMVTTGDGWRAVPNPAQTGTASFFYVINGGTDDYTIISDTASAYYGLAIQNSSSTTLTANIGTPSLYDTGDTSPGHTTRAQWKTATQNATWIQEIVGATWTGLGTTYTISGMSSFSTFFFVGYLGDFIVVNGTPSSGDREKIEGYLAHKWGCAARLPSGHPYKSAAPS